MGAHSIFEEGVGADMGSAYDECVRSALYEHGHDPYSGTIATTQGVVNRTSLLEIKLGTKRKTKKHVRNCLNEWEEDALEGSEKWGPCWGTEVPWNKSTKKRKMFVFVGWAAS